MLWRDHWRFEICAARIAGRCDESITRCGHSFSDVAAQTACAAGYSPHLRHRNPLFCFFDALSAPRYSKTGTRLFLGCGIPGGRAIFAVAAFKPCSTWMLVADARIVECNCKTRVIAIRLAFETLPNDGALKSHVAALALGSI
jgi:hypothetical protein